MRFIQRAFITYHDYNIYECCIGMNRKRYRYDIVGYFDASEKNEIPTLFYLCKVNICDNEKLFELGMKLLPRPLKMELKHTPVIFYVYIFPVDEILLRGRVEIKYSKYRCKNNGILIENSVKPISKTNIKRYTLIVNETPNGFSFALEDRDFKPIEIKFWYENEYSSSEYYHYKNGFENYIHTLFDTFMV